MRGKGGRWEGVPAEELRAGRRGNKKLCWAFEQRSDAQLLGPGRFCAGSYWNLVDQLAVDCSTF